MFAWVGIRSYVKMSTQNNHIPTILIIGAGPGGLSLYRGIQKHLNKNEKRFNVLIFERDTCPKGIFIN